ncbi:MAG: glycosyltransferase family 87 protein [Candidatus Sulfotelmatobacter sp.]
MVAALAAASMWFYMDRILVSYQVADAAAHQRPRGNLSDLYPRWLGARELLLHGRNPYGDDITLEIEKGYYGRALDPARADDPKDRQGFAYPVYVVFVLAPLIGLPFHEVQIFFHWLLLVVTAASVWLWLRALRWRLPPLAIAAGMALTLGSVPGVQGIKLQQLSLLVAALLAGAAACVAGGYLFCGGALLAVATIKPQLAWLFVGWLLVWAVSDWRARRRLVFGFGLVLGGLFAGAEMVLPRWWRMFVTAVGQYHGYTQNESVLEVMIDGILGTRGRVGRVSGEVLAVVALLACLPALWRWRHEREDSRQFGWALAMVLALTVVVAPMYAPYNQVLLLPAIMVLVRDLSNSQTRSRALGFGYLIAAFFVSWQWIASSILMAVYLAGFRGWALRSWSWPFFATFALPICVLVMILSVSMQRDLALPKSASRLE